MPATCGKRPAVPAPCDSPFSSAASTSAPRRPITATVLPKGSTVSTSPIVTWPSGSPARSPPPLVKAISAPGMRGEHRLGHQVAQRAFAAPAIGVGQRRRAGVPTGRRRVSSSGRGEVPRPAPRRAHPRRCRRRSARSTRPAPRSAHRPRGRGRAARGSAHRPRSGRCAPVRSRPSTSVGDGPSASGSAASSVCECPPMMTSMPGHLFGHAPVRADAQMRQQHDGRRAPARGSRRWRAWRPRPGR